MLGSCRTFCGDGPEFAAFPFIRAIRVISAIRGSSALWLLQTASCLWNLRKILFVLAEIGKHLLYFRSIAPFAFRVAVVGFPQAEIGNFIPNCR